MSYTRQVLRRTEISLAQSYVTLQRTKALLAKHGNGVRIALVLAVVIGLAGCNGVTLNAKYAALLDQTAALSAETAARAKAGSLSPEQMVQALDGQAKVWQAFKTGKDGKAQ